MSEDRRMSVDIIPAGERGQFRITDQMLFENDAVSLAAFEVLLREEAARRGLYLEVAEDIATRDWIVRWRPDTESGPMK